MPVRRDLEISVFLPTHSEVLTMAQYGEENKTRKLNKEITLFSVTSHTAYFRNILLGSGIWKYNTSMQGKLQLLNFGHAHPW